MQLSMKSINNNGWNGSIQVFINEDSNKIIHALSNHHNTLMNEIPSDSQLKAWKKSIIELKRELNLIIQDNKKFANYSIIFEYELPRESGRRPDVLILGEDTIFVLEFKDYTTPLQSHIDQVSAYSKDIKLYHSKSHNYNVYPFLILTKYNGEDTFDNEVKIISSKSISHSLFPFFNQSTHNIIDLHDWLSGKYEPLPYLVEAARMIFNHEELPQIKQALSAGIPETIKELIKIADNALKKHEHYLGLITGVPGSGKTLVGLQFVYDNYFKEGAGSKNTVFLSGNGPLVKVLQHALRNKIFVQDVHPFLKEYGQGKNILPDEHVWVYDEAQRAWDSERALEKRGTEISEPLDFLLLGERMPDWAMVIGLIGEGQEIHLGEEAGIKQWNDSLKKVNKKWTVHCPSKISQIFTNADTVKISDKLDLTVTLRSHLAINVHQWISYFLDAEISKAYEISQQIWKKGFNMYVSRSISDCKKYVIERYQNNINKRYGLMASSKAKNLTKYGILNDFNSTQKVSIGPWYNDPPNSLKSCCQLKEVVTEFGSQGLEVDFPIICWGNDLFWGDNGWKIKGGNRSKARDPYKLRLNSYRVLLSRGRDGFLIFIPDEVELDETYNILLDSGLKKLRTTSGPILVTGAIIHSDKGILISQRSESSNYAGYWEFPGGKMEYGEDPKNCLIREVREELGCDIEINSLFDTSSYIYPDGIHYIILFYNAHIKSGNPIAKEHSQLKWIDYTELDNYQFLPADIPIIQKLKQMLIQSN